MQHSLILNYDEFSEIALNQIFEEGDIENIFYSIVEELECMETNQ